MKPLLSSKKKKIVQELHENFGITQVQGLFLQFGKEKVRVYSGSLDKEELRNLDKYVRVETMGMYLAKVQNDGFRLSVDGCMLLRDQVTKGMLAIDDAQATEWFYGEDLVLSEETGFKILTNQGDVIGCGKSTGEKISNSLPKERRVRMKG